MPTPGQAEAKCVPSLTEKTGLPSARVKVISVRVKTEAQPLVRGEIFEFAASVPALAIGVVS